MKELIQLSNQELEILATELRIPVMAEGKCLADLLQVEENLLERLYATAFAHYQGENYDKALFLFDLLVQLQRNYKYYLGHASTLYQMRHYEKAALSFYLAHAAEPHNPYPLFYLAESLINAGHKAQGMEALDQTLLLIENDYDSQYLKDRCLNLKNSLNLSK